MVVASVVSIAAFFNAFGPYGHAFSCFIALGLAFILSPIIAIATKGKYYTARPSAYGNDEGGRVMTCVACGYDYEHKDMASCPFHKGAICSLCCSLEGACHDRCKVTEPAALLRAAE
jgi:hypothetical protein